MFYNDWTIQQLATEHQRELRCQAEAERLAQAAVPRPDRWRWLSWLGQQLIITGQRLQSAAQSGFDQRGAERRD